MARQSVPYPLKRTIGTRIKTLMKRDKVSREQLGNDLDLSKSTVSKILNAVNATGLETLMAFAGYFEVSVDFLLGRTKSQIRLLKTESPDDLKETIAKHLNTLMERDEVSQYRLAKDLKLTEASISKMRNAINTPSLPNLIRLADAFEVTTDDLLGRAPADSESQPSQKTNDPAIAEMT